MNRRATWGSALLIWAGIIIGFLSFSCGGNSGGDFSAADSDTTKYYSPIVIDPEAGEAIDEPEAVEAEPEEYAEEAEAMEDDHEALKDKAVDDIEDLLEEFQTGGHVSSGGGTRAPASIPSPEPEIVPVSFDSANVAFNTPDSMQLGETMRIVLKLSKRLTKSKLALSIDEPGEIRTNRIRVSGLMEANLKGKGFQIEPITKELQRIDPAQDAVEWSWQITALEAGQRTLYLTIDLYSPEGKDFASTTINTLKEEIVVYVTWQQRIATFTSNNWEWLWSAILVPLVGWIYNSRKRKKNSQTA